MFPRPIDSQELALRVHAVALFRGYEIGRIRRAKALELRVHIREIEHSLAWPMLGTRMFCACARFQVLAEWRLIRSQSRIIQVFSEPELCLERMSAAIDAEKSAIYSRILGIADEAKARVLIGRSGLNRSQVEELARYLRLGTSTYDGRTIHTRVKERVFSITFVFAVFLLMTTFVDSLIPSIMTNPLVFLLCLTTQTVVISYLLLPLIKTLRSEMRTRDIANSTPRLRQEVSGM